MPILRVARASVAAHERARQLDPQIATSVAPTYWMLGDNERAIEGFSGFFVGLPQASLGRDAEAIAAARASAATVRDPLTRSYQRVLPLLLEGRIEECRRLLDELAPRNPDPESVFHIARTYARLGATEAALTQFDRAVDMGFLVSDWFVRDPWLAPIASDPRFRDALAAPSAATPTPRGSSAKPAASGCSAWHKHDRHRIAASPRCR